MSNARWAISSRHATLRRTTAVVVSLCLIGGLAVAGAPQAAAEAGSSTQPGSSNASAASSTTDPSSPSSSPPASTPAPSGPAMTPAPNSTTPAPAALKTPTGYSPGVSTEVVADRTATSTTYLNPDGSKTTQISGTPVHYRDTSGAWQNIDTTLHADPANPGTLDSGANSFTASFSPLGSGGGVTISTASGPVSFDPTGAAAVTPVVSTTDPSTVVYANAWPNVDLTYQVTPSGVEEHLLLKSSSAATTFSFATPAVSFGSGVATGQGAVIGGAISKLLGDLTPQGRPSSSGELVAPVVRLASGAPQSSAAPVLASTGNALSVSLSQLWLAAQPTAAFPIDLDPTWVGGASSICFTNTGVQQSPCEMQTGNSLANGNTFWRSIPIFDYSSLDGANVMNASLNLSNQNGGTSAAEQINVYTATGQSFNSLGTYQGSFVTSGTAGSLSNQTLTNTYNSYTSTSYNGVGLILTGYEAGGNYSYKEFQSYTLSLTYDYPPAPISSYSPASGYIAPAPPILSAVTSERNNEQIFYDFEVWTAPNGSGSLVTNQTINEPSGTVAAWQPSASGLTQGTTYWWQVTPNDGYYAGGPSPWNSFTIASPPSAPTGVTATAGDTSATVTWSASTANGTPVTSYTVTSSGGQTVTTSNGSTTSATVTGLTDGTAYTFTVVANSAAGSSAASAASNSVTPVQSLPSPPTGVSVHPGNGQAQVTWAPPTATGTSPVSSYTVTAVPSSGSTVTATASCGWPCNNLIVTGLTNGTSYSFSVIANNATGPSAATSGVNSTPTTTPAPYAPYAAFATPGNGAGYASWTAPANNGGAALTNYYVAAYDITTSAYASGATYVNPTSDPNVNNYNFTGLTNGQTYEFVIYSGNANGYTYTITGTFVPTSSGLPYTPPNATVWAGDGSAVVSWTAPAAVSSATAPTNYIVQEFALATNGAFSYVTEQTVSGTTTSALFSGLTDTDAVGSTVQGYVFTVYSQTSGGVAYPAIAYVPSSGAYPASYVPDYVATPKSSSSALNLNNQILAPSQVVVQGGDQSLLVYFAEPLIGTAGVLTTYTVNLYSSSNTTGTPLYSVPATALLQSTSCSSGNNSTDPPLRTAAVSPLSIQGGSTPLSSACVVLTSGMATTGGGTLSLVNGTSYYTTVTSNLVGLVPLATSSAVGPTVPAGRPFPPTITNITTAGFAPGGEAAVTVQYPVPPASAPAGTAGNNGSVIMTYVVTATPTSGQPDNGTVTATGTIGGSNPTCTGNQNTAGATCTILLGAAGSGTAADGPGSGELYDGTTYQFTVQAQNNLTSSPTANNPPGPFTTVVGTSDPSSPPTTFVPYGVPFAPIIGSATIDGSSGAALTSATVTWSPPAALADGVPGNNGSAISSYIVTASNDVAMTAGGTAMSLDFTGLPPGQYTFVVSAANAAGPGPASGPSNPVTIAGLPSAPTNATVVVSGSGSTATGTVSWGAANSNFSPIQYYTVTQEPGGAYQQISASGPLTAQFANPSPTSFDYYITATNAVGAGPAALAMDSPAPSSGSGSGACSQYCQGSDSNTHTAAGNQQETVYIGQVGTFEGLIGNSGPCPNGLSAEGGCDVPANATYYLPYYFGGGIEFAGSDTAYCWGWAQGLDALKQEASVELNHNIPFQAAMALDIEQGYGWEGHPSDDRNIIDGFGDAVGGFPDGQNCGGTSPFNGSGSGPNGGNGEQLIIYSSAAMWQAAFEGTTSGNLPNTPLWTYGSVNNNPPSSASDFSDADFTQPGSQWAASPYLFAYQYHQPTDDYDVVNMDNCWPYFASRWSTGQSCPGPNGY